MESNDIEITRLKDAVSSVDGTLKDIKLKLGAELPEGSDIVVVVDHLTLNKAQMKLRVKELQDAIDKNGRERIQLDVQIFELEAGEATLKKQLLEQTTQRGVAQSDVVRCENRITTLTADLVEMERLSTLAEKQKALVPPSTSNEINTLRAEIAACRLQLVAFHSSERAHLQKQSDLEKQTEDLTKQIGTKNEEMSATLILLAGQETLVGEERIKIKNLTTYIMELGRLISEVPDLLSSGWDLKPVPATAIMSTRQGIMQCDSLEAANLKLMQGHLQVFDVAVKTLHAHQKQTLEDIADLQLENNALGRELDSQKISIKQYTEYQTLLTLGIIDMADHLKWTMAGLRGQDKI